MKSGFELGRALHVLIDMACPAHAQNSWHYLKDPFERYVEAHASQLAALSVSYASLLPNPFKIESLIDSLAKVAQQEIVFSRRNRSILASKKDGVVAQVQRLIPLAAQHARHLIDAYEKGLAT